MNKGMPMRDVRKCTGIITGAMIVLATASHPSRRAPPKRPDAGMRKRCSPPMIIFVMKGATSSMNPIIPTKQTITALINDAMKIPVFLVFSSSVMDFVSAIISKSRDFSSSKGMQNKMVKTTIPIPVHDALSKLPDIQNIASLAATTLVNNSNSGVRIENKKRNAIPIRTAASGEAPRFTNL